MRIQLSKEKLYEAKWGVVEWYNKWDRSGIGKIHKAPRMTRNHVNSDDFSHIPGYSQQARYKAVMMRKNKLLQQKYLTYRNHIHHYHDKFPDSPILQLPTFEEVKAFSVDDIFWNLGSLTHPSEPWASDKATQSGIQAYRTVRSCEEELRRISLEVRKMVRWSLEMEEKLKVLLNLSNMRVSVQSTE